MFAAGCVLAQGTYVSVISSDQQNSVSLIAQDIRQPHEAKLHGVPAHFDWYNGPRVGMGLNPKRFTAINFANNNNSAADVRPEDSGGVSVTVGNGLNYHFWPVGDRAVLPPAKDIAGIFTTVQARLVVDDPAKPDDRARARLLVGMGGDYWRDADVQWAPNYANNNDIGIGRHRYVKSGWQSFNMTTLSLAGLQKSPSPLR